MKAFITIELEIPYSDEETKETDEYLKKHGKTFKYHLSESTENMLTEGGLPLEMIKSIEVNRVD